MGQPIPEGYVRLTHNRLVTQVVDRNTNLGRCLALLWRKGLEQDPPVTKFTAIGGAALLTEQGLELVRGWGGVLQEPEKKEARIIVPVGDLVELADALICEKGHLIPGMEHELLGELCGNELGLGPILTRKQLEDIQVVPRSVLVMPGSPILRPDPHGRVRDGDATTERIVELNELYVSPEVMAAMLQHPGIREFTPEEVSRTLNGWKDAIADDGVTILGNNMLLSSAR